MTEPAWLPPKASSTSWSTCFQCSPVHAFRLSSQVAVQAATKERTAANTAGEQARCRTGSMSAQTIASSIVPAHRAIAVEATRVWRSQRTCKIKASCVASLPYASRTAKRRAGPPRTMSSAHASGLASLTVAAPMSSCTSQMSRPASAAACRGCQKRRRKFGKRLRPASGGNAGKATAPSGKAGVQPVSQRASGGPPSPPTRPGPSQAAMPWSLCAGRNHMRLVWGASATTRRWPGGPSSMVPISGCRSSGCKGAATRRPSASFQPNAQAPLAKDGPQ
mmetsp:Transcript_48693/g.106388  ORF Transcript_48693/g.106388 Transcript_48693/m.106388 type:complete len:278 (+) Transcript_48693:230-1063(+)